MGPKDYLKHIQDPEKITLLRRLLDKLSMASRGYTVEESDFLDPYERRLARELAFQFPQMEFLTTQREELRERDIVGFAPYEAYIDEGVRSFKITSKFSQLSHPDILGALLGLGIDRSKIGDIAVHGESAYICVKREIGDFLLLEFREVGSSAITVREVANEEMVYPPTSYQREVATVSSMRLDGVVSAVTRKSRTLAKAQVEGGLVKVNFQTILRPAHVVAAGDLLSIRKFGRVQIFPELTTTRKDRIRISYGIIR
ncbi:MAG: YlmH/Sll1252 family protein [Tissierellia bacterium]|nr:YlmH/Sll1252 family protein [Tissierellia bacterium]